MVWSSLVMVLIAGLATLLLGAGVLTARGYAAQGAADLAALAGATAQLAGREACSEATRSAALNGAEVTACTVAGVVLHQHRYGAGTQARAHAPRALGLCGNPGSG